MEVWKGDLFAGSVGIDPSSGLLKLSHGGDFGPIEWFGERTDSVLNSINMDSMKQALGNSAWTKDKASMTRTVPLNKEVANDDVARSKGKDMQAAIKVQSQKISASMKALGIPKDASLKIEDS